LGFWGFGVLGFWGFGSGVIVSEGGLILTAAHVSDGFQELDVIFPDGRQRRGSVLGANYSRDVSMIQLHGKAPWPYVEMGESEELQVGDFVVAMGHSEGFDPTRPPPVRFGRVMTRKSNEFVTTDCTLIGGDSGGPLFSLSGQLVGIHSHIAKNNAINNHACIDGVKRSWSKMLKGRSWGTLGEPRRDHDRPVLGVRLEKTEEGELVVARVVPHSPVDAVRVLSGDIIASVENIPVSDPDDVREVLIDYEPGDKVNVIVKRGADEVEKEVLLASAFEVTERSRR